MKTQSEMILEYLQSGRTLTQLEALNRFGCARLASRIHELREDGHNIATRSITVDRAHGGKANVTEYRLVV